MRKTTAVPEIITVKDPTTLTATITPVEMFVDDELVGDSPELDEGVCGDANVDVDVDADEDTDCLI